MALNTQKIVLWDEEKNERFFHLGKPSSLFYKINGSVNSRNFDKVVKTMKVIADNVLLPKQFREKKDVVRTVTYEDYPLIRYSIEGTRRVGPDETERIRIRREYQIVNGKIIDFNLEGKLNRFKQDFK